MPRYGIELTSDARQDLSYLSAYERKMILDQMKSQLPNEPLTETRNRKMLRDSPLAPWELRIGKWRAFYQVLEDTMTVSVVAIGYKEHNVLHIRGEEVEI